MQRDLNVGKAFSAYQGFNKDLQDYELIITWMFLSLICDYRNLYSKSNFKPLSLGPKKIVLAVGISKAVLLGYMRNVAWISNFKIILNTCAILDYSFPHDT